MCFFFLFPVAKMGNVTDRAMRERDEAERMLAERLRRAGHLCVRTVASYPRTTLWCHREPCRDTSDADSSDGSCGGSSDGSSA